MICDGCRAGQARIRGAIQLVGFQRAESTASRGESPVFVTSGIGGAPGPPKETMAQRERGSWLIRSCDLTHQGTCRMRTMTRIPESTAAPACLLLAFELSERTWKLGFTTG